MSKNRHSSADIEVGSTIFETIFDLTEDRLRRLFHLFDESNSGTISYRELQLGFAYHFGVGGEIQRMSQLDDDQAFRVLVEYLDADKSGEITFEEFSEGIRLLILRSILQEVHYSSRSGGSSNSSSSSDSSEDSVLTEVFDYNSIRFERYLLKGSGQLEEQPQARNCSFTICSKSLVDFFLQPRQDKVSVRWINISGKKASNIMKLMALKYRLHPLALQDALEHTVHRPKADSYDRHYFIMVPVFYWKGGNEESCNNQRVSSDAKTRERECNWWCSRFSRAKRKSVSGDKDYDTATDDDKSIDPNDDSQDKNLIGLHTTSIFISKPCGRTVITFNNEANDDGCWHNLQTELRMDYSKLRQYDGQHLAYRLLDEAVDKIEEIVKKLKAVFQREKKAIIQDNYKNLDKIHSLKHEMHSMSRKFKPFLRLLVHVIEDDSFSPEATIYLRDVLDNLEIHDEDVKSLIAKCESVDEEAEKLQAKKMDATLYTLTVVSAVFLPAQFLTGKCGFSNNQYCYCVYGIVLFGTLVSHKFVCDTK